MVIDEVTNNPTLNSTNNCTNVNINKVNGFMNGSSSRSGNVGEGRGAGSSLRTYKRRKCAASSSTDLTVKDLMDPGLQKGSFERVCDPKVNGHSLLNGSDDCFYEHWRNVLETICQSLSPTKDGSGGIEDSIRDVLSQADTSHGNMSKGFLGHHIGQCHLPTSLLLNGCSTTIEGPSAVTSNGSLNEAGHSSVSRLCRSAFVKLFMSGKFIFLCKLLSENFHGRKIEKLLDFSHINSRMKEGVYEHTPMLLSSDIQQIWKRVDSIGNELVSLSNNLCELSRTFCHELGGDAEADTSSDRKREVSVRDSSMRIKPDPEGSVSCTCKQCGERSDGRDCLVCDSCEAVFHVSCIEPAVKEIPHKSWYCASCTSSGVVSPHEECVVCERLNVNSGVHGGVDASYEESFEECEESLDGLTETGPQVFKGSKVLPCKICAHNLNDGDQFRVCEHRFCQFKYYHIDCLSSKELESYGPKWYCPSCLCRVCLTDKDDENIVMCDGCDHGYHIYCMNPPRTTIPKGKWFCPSCDAGLKEIRKVKKVYEHLERKHKKSEGNVIHDDSSKKDGSPKKEKSNSEDMGGSGGMDMLLTAARTLNGEVSDVQNVIR